MNHLPATLLFLALATSVRAAPVPGVDTRPISPVIQFSDDEQTVTLRYEKGDWTFHRPVVSPWKFTAAGTTYWVDAKGQDSGDGSSQNPFQTIAKAISLVEAGDVVYLRAGTYVENLLITKSGIQGRLIILTCAPAALGQVKLTPPKEYVTAHPSGGVIELRGSHFFWINGLVIEGPRGRPEAPAMETYGANGITFAGKAGEGCRATNNVIYGNVHCGIKEMGHGGTHITLEANLIFENGTESRDHGIYCPAGDMTLNGNILLNNAGYGIHAYSHPARQRITRNLCIGNKVCGIILAGSESQVFNNVCAFNGLGIMYFRGGCKGNIVKNNIFAFNKTDCAYDNGGGHYGDPKDNVHDFNCYFPGKPSNLLPVGSHEILADPDFLDAKSGDYRLKPQSPCKGKGGDVGSREAIDPGAF